MIPALSSAAQCEPLIKAFINDIIASGFSGDIATDYAARLTMATDNSIYQQLPQAVLFPCSTDDVSMILRLANQTDYSQMTLTPRGGGTGTNGQSLNLSVVIDLSRYMNRILEINTEEGWVRVEAGVIKDQLNQAIQSAGYFFSPELSTSNRATIGGMINTDASGQGSLVYGKTSDHLLGLRSVLMTGDVLDSQPMSIEEASQLAKQSTPIGQIYQKVLSLCQQHRTLILEKFPRLTRFLTGYDLRHVISDDETQFDLSRLIAGSEGSLAIVTEAKLNIIPLPKIRYLVNVKYDSFDAALRHANFLLAAEALSVETVDSTILNLAKTDIIWSSVADLLTEIPGKSLLGINIVEFAGHDQAEIEQKVSQLVQRLTQLVNEEANGVLGFQLCTQPEEVARIYAMRKKAVGLLGNSQGRAKPIPFVEDTAVPPEHLADYIQAFRAILDAHQLTYGMFGHVDAGVLHVRPAIDLEDVEQVKKIKLISDQIVVLTAQYGGLIWGEHGKGFRSEYVPAYFGKTLYDVLQQIKGVFDPSNRLNPGKICTPKASNADVAQVNAPLRADFDRQIPIEVRQQFQGAMSCNGNGLCFNFDVHSAMCPSMKISGDRIHSPKGRAGLVREWLRLLNEQDVTPQQLEKQLTSASFSLRHLLKKLQRSVQVGLGRESSQDFSHEVYQAMKGCLSCKACSTQCPIKIDVPAFRSQFLHLYHSRYWRPLQDHVVAQVETYSPLMAKAPKTFNFFLSQKWVQVLSQKMVGMVNLPLLSVPALAQQLKGHPTANLRYEQLIALPVAERVNYLLIVQDAFTQYYDAQVVMDLVRLVERMGYYPVVLPLMANGKPKHIKGFLPEFKQVAAKTAAKLNRFAELGMEMVAIDPAMALVYRDEYPQVLGELRGEFHIQVIHEWLYQHRTALPQRDHLQQTPWYLFGHCTESSALTQYGQQWQAIFDAIGQTLQVVTVGCCGMAGTYGHEVKNQATSMALFDLSWRVKLADKPISRCLATGYSCRSQVKRLMPSAIKHPIQALLTCLDNAY